MVENGSGRLIELTVNGHVHSVPDRGDTLLGVLRDDLGLTGAKDGCSPQGQCGCCTVLVDGQPRVACVTPARRVRGRSITTIEGMTQNRRDTWGSALCASGGSQCGFCTPGIVLRLEASLDKLDDEFSRADAQAVSEQALLAHMCRCTGWQTITDAFVHVATGTACAAPELTEQRAERIRLEGGVPQVMSPASALGEGGFAADTAPDDALVAVMAGNGQWVVGENLAEARSLAGKVQGRRTTMDHHYPVALPEGQFVAALQTTWTDPAYLETDASWCVPGGTPSSSLANGGAFGGKLDGHAEHAASELAEHYQRPVLVLFSREDVMRLAPKRPPLAGGIREDGSGVLRVAQTAGIEDLVAQFAPEFTVETVDVPGPATSISVRGAVWAEIAVLRSALTADSQPIEVVSPTGGVAVASGGVDGIRLTVRGGEVLDQNALVSYCVGAAHMGWSWATSEAMTTDADGEIHDLTVRSLGIMRAIDTPTISVEVVDEPGQTPVNVSDAVFAACAGLAWRASGHRQTWPVDLGSDVA